MKSNKEFFNLIKKNDREKAVLFVLDLLNKNKLSIIEFFENLIIPTMKEIQIGCEHKNENFCVSKKQIMLNILRTTIECSYPYIITKKEKLNGRKVIVISPEGEISEIGALIATYFFEMAGFETQYLGANTKTDNLLKALKWFKPNYIAIGISNFYNAIQTREIIDESKKMLPRLKIVAGGPAFSIEDVEKILPHDFFIRKYSDILKLEKEDK